MTRLKLILVSLLAALALVGAACGGDSDEVPADAIAVVDGNAIDKSEFDALIGQAKKSYELQKRDFPKVGSPEYNTLKNQAVQFLVQREQFELKADELDVEVTDKQVDDRLTQIKKQYFQGSDKKYQEQLKQQGLTEESVKRDIRAQLVQEGIFKKVTEETQGHRQGDPGLLQQEQGAVRDAGAARRPPHPRPDEEAGGRHLRPAPGRRGLRRAREEVLEGSRRPRRQGGKLTIARGQTVAPFDHTAFLSRTGQVSRPVKTQYGFHIIEPIGDIKPAETTELSKVKESIRQQLLQTKRNER